jgi:hypothetical protein
MREKIQEAIERWYERLARLAWLSAECCSHERARGEMREIEETIRQLRQTLRELASLREDLQAPSSPAAVPSETPAIPSPNPVPLEAREFALLSPAPPFFVTFSIEGGECYATESADKES